MINLIALNLVLMLLIKRLKQALFLTCIGFWIIFATIIPAIAPAIAAPNPIVMERLEVFKERFNNLEGYVKAQNWPTIKTYIHGPFGQVRQDIRQATGGLSTKDRVTAKNLTKQFVADLVKIDFAASDRDIDRTEAAFEQSRNDFDRLVSLIENS
jgi:photosystem II protein PsbQ